MQAEPQPPKLVIVKTKDGVQYKIQHDLFLKYSPFYNTMIQDSEEEEVFNLFTINSTEFDYLFEFMQLHKHQEPEPLKPLKPELSVRDVMEEADAELIERIYNCSPHKIKLIIDAAYFLHMNQLMKRLTAGIMAGLDRKRTSNMIAEGKKSGKVDEVQVSKQIHNKINMVLFKNKMKQDNYASYADEKEEEEQN